MKINKLVCLWGCYCLVALALGMTGLIPVASSRADQAAPQSKDDVTLDLKRCIEIALEKNFDILEAREQVEKNYQVSLQIRSDLLPHISIVGTADKLDRNQRQSDVTSFSLEKSTWSAEIEASQVLFEGGRDLYGYEVQKLRVEAARKSLESQVNAVIFKVKEIFLRSLLNKAQVKVQEENVRLLSEELRTQELKRDAKIVSDFNVLRAEVALANAKAPLIHAQNDAAIGIEELREALGLEISQKDSKYSKFDIRGELRLTPTSINLEQALDEALKQRPDLKEVEILHNAAKRGIRIAKADYLPNVQLVGSYGSQGYSLTNNSDGNLHGWTTGLRLSWKIFDGLQTAAKASEARVDERIAKLLVDRTRLHADVEVRRAFYSLQDARELVKASLKVVEQGQESLRLARARFDANAGTQLDILDAQVRLTEARTNEIQALHDYKLAQAGLETAMGTPSLE